MEVIKGYSGIVKFPVPTGLATATATVTSGETSFTPVSVTIEAGVASVTIPYSAVQDERDLVIKLTFSYEGADYTKEKRVNVISPLLESWEIDEIIAGEDVDTWEIESAVRHVINAHTGQTFGKFMGTKQAVGAGSNALSLPARLLSLTTITTESPGVDLYGTFNINGDGWYLLPATFGEEGHNIKADISDYTIGVNGVIHNPYGYRAGVFHRDVRYSVDGIWGYEEIPVEVREAAKLLINDYAHVDSVYRDKYLESLTSPDWRIQFGAGAFARTGNVRADQLLANFVLKRGWAVI